MPFELPHPRSYPLLSLTLIVVSALMMTLCMFLFMAYLVDNKFDTQTQSITAPNFQTTYTPPEVKPTPPKVKPEPMTPALTIPQTGENGQFVEGPIVTKPTEWTAPKIINPPMPPTVFKQSDEDRMAIPVFKIAPDYPIRELTSGTEGYVVLSFDVRADGSVHNVRVEQAEPKRVFNKAAKKALTRWRYQPRIADGKPVAQPNQVVRLDFKINQ